MSEFDPFANVPADEAQVPEAAPLSEPPVEAPKKAPAKKAAAKEDGDSKIVLTFKEGAGFDSSWVVVHASSVAEADSVLDAAFAALLEKTKKVATHFRGSELKAASGGGAPARPGAEAPAGVPPAPGPDWVFKTGMGKNGKTWKAWMPPRGSDASPVWL